MNEPDGHVWEALTLSYTRRPRVEARGHEGSAETLIDYLNPRLPAGLRRVQIPVVNATPEALLPYGRYIHPNIWHEGVFGLSGTQRFFDKQGAVHARVSVDFAREFGCLLEASFYDARSSRTVSKSRP